MVKKTHEMILVGITLSVFCIIGCSPKDSGTGRPNHVPTYCAGTVEKATPTTSKFCSDSECLAEYPERHPYTVECDEQGVCPLNTTKTTETQCGSEDHRKAGCVLSFSAVTPCKKA